MHKRCGVRALREVSRHQRADASSQLLSRNADSAANANLQEYSTTLDFESHRLLPKCRRSSALLKCCRLCQTLHVQYAISQLLSADMCVYCYAKKHPMLTALPVANAHSHHRPTRRAVDAPMRQSPPKESYQDASAAPRRYDLMRFVFFF